MKQRESWGWVDEFILKNEECTFWNCLFWQIPIVPLLCRVDNIFVSPEQSSICTSYFSVFYTHAVGAWVTNMRYGHELKLKLEFWNTTRQMKIEKSKTTNQKMTVNFQFIEKAIEQFRFQIEYGGSQEWVGHHQKSLREHRVHLQVGHWGVRLCHGSGKGWEGGVSPAGVELRPFFTKILAWTTFVHFSNPGAKNPSLDAILRGFLSGSSEIRILQSIWLLFVNCEWKQPKSKR